MKMSALLPRVDGRGTAVLLAFGLGYSVRRLVSSRWGGAKDPQRRDDDSAEEEKEVSESTIRLMTRIAMEHGAVNLSQGFPNEPPMDVMARHAAGALLAGESEASAEAMAAKLEPLLEEKGSARRDVLNQYSYPFGAPCLREAIAAYYQRWYGLQVDPATEITVVCGATEGFASCLRGLCKPGDVAVFFQPFHELYPSQVKLFYLKARAVTLQYAAEDGAEWTFDTDELDAALSGASVLLFNSPHNPTGKVFSPAELALIADLCRKHGVTAVTDEIYEHVRFGDDEKHLSLFQDFLGRENAVLVNSISKTASATGWRVGWVIADAERSRKIRAVHDQLVAGCATPLQFGVAALLGSDHDFNAIAPTYFPKRDVLVDALSRNGFLPGPVPRGAYYVFANYTHVPTLQSLSPVDAALYLTKVVKVACVPGDNFYLSAADKQRFGSRFLRFAFVRSLDILHQAAANLDRHFSSPSSSSSSSGASAAP